MSFVIRVLYLGPKLPADFRSTRVEVAGPTDFLSVRNADINGDVLEVFRLPVCSPPEAATMAAIFHRVRRVRALGALYTVADGEEATAEATPTEEGEPACPHCGAVLTPILYPRPIAEVLADGFEDLDQFRHRHRGQPRAGPIAA
jgi:hypothetical protein